MAITLEQAEKLREKADVTLEEAKAALEAADGDLLDALIWLERQGKTIPRPGGAYSTRDGQRSAAPPEAGRTRPEEDPGKSFGDKVRELFQKSLDNAVQVERNGQVMTTVPVLAAAALLLLAFWVVLPLMVVGLFFGFRYHFSGPDLGRENVNRVMDKVTDTAEDIRENVKQNWRRP